MQEFPGGGSQSRTLHNRRLHIMQEVASHGDSEVDINARKNYRQASISVWICVISRCAPDPDPGLHIIEDFILCKWPAAPGSRSMALHNRIMRGGVNKQRYKVALFGPPIIVLFLFWYMLFPRGRIYELRGLTSGGGVSDATQHSENLRKRIECRDRATNRRCYTCINNFDVANTQS